MLHYNHRHSLTQKQNIYYEQLQNHMGGMFPYNLLEFFGNSGRVVGLLTNTSEEVGLVTV